MIKPEYSSVMFKRLTIAVNCISSITDKKVLAHLAARSVPVNRHTLLCVLSIVASLFYSGCTVVRVQGNDVRTELYPGVVRVSVSAARDIPTVISTHGFGLVMTTQSNTLGWVRERAVLFPDSTNCRVVFIENTPEQAAMIVEQLARFKINSESICTINQGELQ